MTTATDWDVRDAEACGCLPCRLNRILNDFEPESQE